MGSDCISSWSLLIFLLLSLIRLVLEKNHFQFNNDNCLQKMGIAIGPSTWLRFLDDIFMVWDHSLESLHSFIDALNSFHPSIKITCSISTKKVNFLDVTVSKSENLDFVTDVYVKSTIVHQYVEYSSCRPTSFKNGIPYRQGKIYRRIISNDSKFQENILQLRDIFLERNYPESIVDEALSNVSSLTQDDALQTSVKSVDKSVIPFVI